MSPKLIPVLDKINIILACFLLPSSLCHQHFKSKKSFLLFFFEKTNFEKKIGCFKDIIQKLKNISQASTKKEKITWSAYKQT